MKQLLTGLFLLVLAAGAMAETEISGTLFSGTWTLDGSPYILVDDTNLPHDRELVIEPGVQVLANPDVVFAVYGDLEAVGTEDQPILFDVHGDDGFWIGFGFIEGDATFVHCVFRRAGGMDTHMNGGAIWAEGSTLEFEHCVFEHNRAPDWGSAISLADCQTVIAHCRFSYNWTESMGGAVSVAAGTTSLHHSVFSHNEGVRGGALHVDMESFLAVDHCTFFNNTGIQASTFFVDGGLLLKNSIVWPPSDNQLSYLGFDDSFVEFTWSCLPPGDIGGEGVIHENPRFVHPDEGNFHLMETSPCIDAGDPDGGEDPDGTRTDMGAFYFHQDGGGPDGPVLSLPEVHGAPGSTVNLPLHIHEVGPDMGVMAFEVDVEYNTGPVTVVEVLPVPDGPAGDWLLDWNVTGEHVVISGAGADPLAGGGPLARLVVDVHEDAELGAVSEFIFVDAQLNEGVPEVAVQHGAVVVNELMYGDVSGDGDVSAYDASLVLGYLAGTVDLTDAQWVRAEVSGDDEVGALDAGLILAYTVGNIDSFPVEDGDLWQGDGVPVVPGITWQAWGELLYFADIGVEAGEDVLALTLDMSLDQGLVDLVSAEALVPNATVTTESDGTELHVYLALSEPYSGSGELLRLGFEPNDLAGPRDVIWDNLTYDQITINDFVSYENAGMTAIGSTDVTEGDAATAMEHGLVKAYPNPFNPALTVSVQLEHADNVTLRVVDVLGREVFARNAGRMSAGEHTLTWNGSGHAAGVYFLHATVGGHRSVQKVMLLK